MPPPGRSPPTCACPTPPMRAPRSTDRGRLQIELRVPSATCTVIAVGPMLDRVREAVADRRVNLLYASTRASAGHGDPARGRGRHGYRAGRAVPRRDIHRRGGGSTVGSPASDPGPRGRPSGVIATIRRRDRARRCAWTRRCRAAFEHRQIPCARMDERFHGSIPTLIIRRAMTSAVRM